MAVGVPVLARAPVVFALFASRRRKRSSAMVVKRVGGGKFQPVSKKGKPLGKPGSKKKAIKRLRQVEFFKKRKK